MYMFSLWAIYLELNVRDLESDEHPFFFDIFKDFLAACGTIQYK